MDKQNIEKLAEIKELLQASSSSDENSFYAKEIISALRNGVVPNKGVLNFSVGREKIFKEINRSSFFTYYCLMKSVPQPIILKVVVNKSFSFEDGPTNTICSIFSTFQLLAFTL